MPDFEKSLRELAIDRRIRHRAGAKRAGRLAARHQRLRWVAGLPGAVIGAIGAALFFIDDAEAAAWVVLAAGVVTALAAIATASRLAAREYRRQDCLASLADRIENAIASGREPTRAELDAYADELRDCAGESAARR